MSEEILEEEVTIEAPVTEEVVVETEEIVVEEVQPVVESDNATVKISLGTKLLVFSGNCGGCGAYNCNSLVKEGKMVCTTCKQEISV